MPRKTILAASDLEVTSPTREQGRASNAFPHFLAGASGWYSWLPFTTPYCISRSNMPFIRVQYLAQLRDVVDRADEELEIPPGCTLAELLATLAARHGQHASPHLVTPGGEPQRALLTIVNETAISPRESAATLLKEGDIVTLMPPIAGG